MHMNIKYEKQIGSKIKELRIRNNLTQDLLAARLQIKGCDLSRSVLAKIEVGQRHIYPDEIKAFKEIFGIEYDELFVEKIEP